MTFSNWKTDVLISEVDAQAERQMLGTQWSAKDGETCPSAPTQVDNHSGCAEVWNNQAQCCGTYNEVIGFRLGAGTGFIKERNDA